MLNIESSVRIVVSQVFEIYTFFLSSNVSGLTEFNL